MIICPKCNADNQIGAIFCRGCGEKLDLDELKPETVMRAAKALHKTSFNVLGLIKNLIMLTILVVLVGFLMGLFMKPPLPAVEANPTKDTKALKDANQRLADYRNQTKSYVKSSFDDLHYFGVILLGLTAEEIEQLKKDDTVADTNALRMTEFYVELLEPGENNRFRFTMKEQHTKYAWMRLYNVVEGHLSVSENTGLSFTPDTVRMGKIPMNFSEFTRTRVLEHFSKAIEGKAELVTLQKEIKRIEWKDDEVRFYRTTKAAPKGDAPRGDAPRKKKKDADSGG